MSERVCKGCGETFANRRPNQWYCSDNCRKRRWDREEYRKYCADCDTEIYAHRERCRRCHDIKRVERHHDLLDRIERMWNAGLSMREIASALGRPGGPHTVGAELDELRKSGRIGYRYKAYEDRAA